MKVQELQGSVAALSERVQALGTEAQRNALLRARNEALVQARCLIRLAHAAPDPQACCWPRMLRWPPSLGCSGHAPSVPAQQVLAHPWPAPHAGSK